MATIFLSYSRLNVTAVTDLERRLVERGHEVWRDEAALPEASIWRDEIIAAIERSDVFLFAVTRQSLQSGEVRKEFERARDAGKRIIPVVLDDTRPEAAPPDLHDINWIPIADARALERIDAAIRTDLLYLQRHTRFFLSGREWERTRAVLRGESLREALAWLASSASKEPAPTDLHRHLIQASLVAQRRRRIALGVTAVIFVAIAVWLFFTQQGKRVNQRNSLANGLADDSVAEWKNRHYDRAMLLAVAAYQAAPTASALRALLNAAKDEPQLEVVLHGHNEEVGALAFDPRGGRLASGGGDKDGIHLFDTTLWKPLATMGGPSPRISELQFAGDGSFLAAGDWDGVIRRWDVVTRKLIGEPLVQHHGIVESIAVHPGKRFLAAGYTDGGVLWDLAASPPTATDLPVTPSRRVNAVAFADDGATLLAVEGADTLVSWAFADGVLTNRHATGLGASIVALAAHGSTIAAGLNDGMLVWLRGPELTEVRRIAAHPGSLIMGLAFDSYGERLASAGADGSVRIWKSDRDAALLRFDRPPRVLAVTFDPKSSHVALSGSDPAIHVLDLDMRQPLAEVLHRINGSIEDVAFDEQGKSVLVTTLDGERTKVDVASGNAQPMPARPEEKDDPVIAERAGVRIAGYQDGHLQLSQGSTSRALPGAKLTWVMTLAFSPDGKALVAGDNSGQVAEWETTSWTFVRSWKTPDSVAWIAFSPDGQRLAVVDSGTPRITVIDRSAAVTTDFEGSCKRTFSVAFSRDGRTLVTGCEDGSIAMFDPSTRTKLGNLDDLEDPSQPDFVKALARHPSENRFAAGTEDGRVMLWTLDPSFWMRRACRRANRDLPDAIPGWSGAPLVPCSALLKGAPADERKPDVPREPVIEPLIPSNTNIAARLHPTAFRLHGRL